MSPKIRTVTTASGATAVQIIYSYAGGTTSMEHIGSAHSDAELAALKAEAARRIQGDQLDLGLDIGDGSVPASTATGTAEQPWDVTAQRSGYLLDAIDTAYRAIGLDVAADGSFTGRHGLISCTTGTPAETYAPDGIEGDIERLLWPINNGIFHYLGMDPYRPFVTFAPRFLSDEQRQLERERYAEYLRRLGPDDELPMHSQQDYDDDERLRGDVAPHSGFQYRP